MNPGPIREAVTIWFVIQKKNSCLLHHKFKVQIRILNVDWADLTYSGKGFHDEKNEKWIKIISYGLSNLESL